MKSLHRAVALATLLLTACSTTIQTKVVTPTPTAGATATPTPFTTGKVSWTTCHVSFQCGTLQVPLDYRDNSAGTINLALVRLPAVNQARRIGSLLVNPGGPGASGVEFVEQASALFGTLNERFDIVGFDPRGVGGSAPVRCVTPSQMDAFISINPEPQTPADIQAAVTASRNFAEGCVKNSIHVLPYVGTENAARDMDQIRAAVGDPKLTYMGFSYGTLLGATYADLFPAKVRALVLDGAVDPAVSADGIARAQAQGFETNLQAFLGQCAAKPACVFYNGGNPQAALDALFARVQTTPLTVGARHVGIGEAYLGVLAALYSPDEWTVLDAALHRAQTGDGALLLTLADSYDGRHADGTYSNELEANTAINCDDGPTPGNLSHLEALAQQLLAVSPHFGIASAFGPLTCDYWPVAATGRHALAAAGAPPIIVIGGSNDPATPYAWAEGLAHELQSAILVTRTGDGHVSYDKSSCIRAIADAYLVTPSDLPVAGTVCPSDT